MDGATFGQVAQGCIRKQVKQVLANKTVKQGLSMVSASIPSSRLLLWVPALAFLPSGPQPVSQINSFPLSELWPHFITTTEKQTKTNHQSLQGESVL